MASLSLKVSVKGLPEMQQAFEEAAAAIKRAIDSVERVVLETEDIIQVDATPQGGV